MIQVLVAEDSATIRQLLVEILRSDPGIRVVGEARDGVEAVAMTASLRPSVVTMDIQMPGMDGFDATRRIMVEAPTPIVIVSGSNAIHEIEVSMRALRAGALTVLPTPRGPEAVDFEDQACRFLETIKAMSHVKVVRRWALPELSSVPAARQTTLPTESRPRVVALAASTGGPAALSRILSNLHGDFPPVLVVQHIAPGFVDGFVSWLDATGPLRVKVAEHREPLLDRTVYVAPDAQHMGVGDSRIMLSGAPAIEGCRPSATYMFESVARAYGRSTVSVILTGMGQDGVAGLRMIRAAGGRIFAQDEASCVVFGMPAAAISEGLVDATLPLDGLAQRLRKWTEP